MRRRARSLTLAALVVVAGAHAGCAHARTGTPVVAPRASGWVVVPNVTMVAQADETDCGPAALTMALTRWHASPSPDAWQPRAGASRARDGFSAGALRDEARRAGFESFVFEGTFDDLSTEVAAGHPVVVGLVHVEHDRATSHFAVVVGHDTDARHWLLADPALGVHAVTRDTLRVEWGHAGWVTLVVFPAAE